MLSNYYLTTGFILPRIRSRTVGFSTENLVGQLADIAAVPMGTPPGPNASDRDIVEYIIREWRRHNAAGVATYPWQLPGLGYLRPLNLCVPNVNDNSLKRALEQVPNEYTPAGKQACLKFRNFGGYSEKEANTFGMIPNAIADPAGYLRTIRDVAAMGRGAEKAAPLSLQNLVSYGSSRKSCGSWCDHEINAAQVFMWGELPFSQYQKGGIDDGVQPPTNIALWILNYTAVKQGIANQVAARQAQSLQENLIWFEQSMSRFRQNYGADAYNQLLNQIRNQPEGNLEILLQQAVAAGNGERVNEIRSLIAERITIRENIASARSALQSTASQAAANTRQYVEERDSMGDWMSKHVASAAEAVGLPDLGISIPDPGTVMLFGMGGAAAMGALGLRAGIFGALQGVVVGGVLGAIGSVIYVNYFQKSNQN